MDRWWRVAAAWRAASFATGAAVSRLDEIEQFFEAHDIEGLFVSRLREAAGDKLLRRLKRFTFEVFERQPLALPRDEVPVQPLFRIVGEAGLLPLCAVTVFEGELEKKHPEIVARCRQFLETRSDLFALIHDPAKRGQSGRRLAAVLDESRLRRVLARMLDENEFLSPFGIRSLSRCHAEHPFEFRVGGVWDFVMHGPDGTDYQEWITWTEITPPERIALLHGESRGDPNAFGSVLTFAPDGAATRIELRTVFPTREQRDEAVEKYHAIEGGQQTLGNLAAYVAELVRENGRKDVEG